MRAYRNSPNKALKAGTRQKSPRPLARSLGKQMNDLPMADAISSGTDIDKVKRVIIKRNLGGLANNTKWNELISFIRNREGWKPSYRSKYVTGYMSEWGTEWFYHLPFPFVGVEWFDISLISNGKSEANWLIQLAKDIGFDFEVRENILRIWGYGPRSYEGFAQ